jgi:hypothetical protein
VNNTERLEKSAGRNGKSVTGSVTKLLSHVVSEIGWEAWTQSKSKSEIPQKMVKPNANAVNRAICGKPKTQQHWEIRNIKNRPMS